jgi:hypothetical protein
MPMWHVRLTSDQDERAKASALTGLGLLLNRRELDDLVLQALTKEVIDDLSLLDGDREEEDLLERLDLAILDETTELGDRHPLLLLIGATAATAATTTTATATAALATTAALTATTTLKTTGKTA